MSVGDGDDNNGLIINAVDHGIRKAIERMPANLRFYLKGR